MGMSNKSLEIDLNRERASRVSVQALAQRSHAAMNKLVYSFLFIFLYSLQIPISHADTGDDILAVHFTDDFHMIIPSGWRELPINAGAIVFFLNGDGLGFPAIDDTGSPLQVGMTVEKFANLTISLEEWENRLANGFKKDPRLKLKEQKIERDITLSDGLKANYCYSSLLNQTHAKVYR